MHLIAGIAKSAATKTRKVTKTPKPDFAVFVAS